jgi:cytochrome P450
MPSVAEFPVLPRIDGIEPVPAHVPPELVRPFPYVLGATSKATPHGFIKAIHEGPEVFWAERCFNGLRGAWVVRGLEALQQLYQDTEHYTARGLVPFATLVGDSWHLALLETDPPMHSLLRAAINPLFTPRRVAELEDRICIYAREDILAFRNRGACEFMNDFAFEFPVKVFLELMGLPQSGRNSFSPGGMGCCTNRTSRRSRTQHARWLPTCERRSRIGASTRTTISSPSAFRSRSKGGNWTTTN